ncbi:hypothetical protein [Prochlorococcus sp. MIT 1223]|uniref:hypothetical protein n=1 Tax=Prochlorococcus sp. MIT 1223 TaxID=3096217 RepID=UPI002A7602DD|nr:hypothetical protein [Prochlorococcus sp. MIT 1223]
MNYFNALLKRILIAGVILLNFFYPFDAVTSVESVNWEKLAQTSDKLQFIDTESIKYKKGILSFLTRLDEVTPENNETTFAKPYLLQVDCDKRLFKNNDSDWQSSRGNKFMTDIVINSCSY